MDSQSIDALAILNMQFQWLSEFDDAQVKKGSPRQFSFILSVIMNKIRELKEDNIIEVHPYILSPKRLLIDYPALFHLVLLEFENLNKGDRRRYFFRSGIFKDQIQFCGWTCAVEFIWEFKKIAHIIEDSELFIKNVKLSLLSPVPSNTNHYE